MSDSQQDGPTVLEDAISLFAEWLADTSLSVDTRIWAALSWARAAEQTWSKSKEREDA